jgi:hypothetical protein
LKGTEEGQKKWKGSYGHRGEDSVGKMPVPARLSPDSKPLPSKLQHLSCKNGSADPKFTLKVERAPCSQNNLEKENEFGGLTFLILKLTTMHL